MIKALEAAKKQGADLRIITYRERLNDVNPRVTLSTLRAVGIPIKVNRYDCFIPLKQVVVDDEGKTNGSINHDQGRSLQR